MSRNAALASVTPRDRPSLDTDITSPKLYGDMRALDAEFARLRERSPVAWVDRAPYRPFWAILRHDDILAIERQHELFINEPRLCLIPREIEEQSGSAMAGGLRETFKVLMTLARLSQRP
ncbi:MAG: hypothetical protein FJ179_10530, partial [Gammaproteobacteria bacterium]|nr:hypothetical protein [Gammaproteobacteria bacterium]